MTSTAGGPIPYAILFGGDQFMVFSLFEDPNRIGATRYGLFCSDIIKVSDISSPFIPLVTFMLLGRETPAHLRSSKLAIPICMDDPVLESETVVARAQGKRYLLTDTLKMSKIVCSFLFFFRFGSCRIRSQFALEFGCYILSNPWRSGRTNIHCCSSTCPDVGIFNTV